MQLEQEVVVQGHPICRGIAVGKPFFLCRDDFAIFETHIPAAHMQREIERYRNALSRSKQDIKRLQKQLEIEAAVEGILILEAQLEMLEDPLLTIEIEKEIKKNKKNVEFIFQQALLKLQERFQSINDSFFKERFQDIQDLSRRILSYLNENGKQSLNHVPPNSIVCAEEFTPSDTASANAFCVSAFVSQTGGTTSHAAIVAKSKGIPCITNVNLQVIRENVFNLMIVDGHTGKIILNPCQETLKEYELLQDKLQSQFKVLKEITKWPAQTYDGYSIRLCANLDMTNEIELIHDLRAEGIGLFRSEYIFLPSNEIPSETEQIKIYCDIIDRMKGLPVVIRTFDVEGDKANLSSTFLSENVTMPSFGMARFMFKEQKLFKNQLRAILQASVDKSVSILFPMISTLSELKEAKRILHEARVELNLFHPLRLGCMIEVPSAALNANSIVKECDFLSIGTNDLIQYALAFDRRKQGMHEFYEPTDPSIIRLIKLVMHEANNAEIPVSVCGEIASDPHFTALLLGLGIQELSVPPRYLPIIKNTIRKTSIVAAVELAEKALRMSTSQEVLEVISKDFQKNFPDDLYY